MDDGSIESDIQLARGVVAGDETALTRFSSQFSTIVEEGWTQGRAEWGHLAIPRPAYEAHVRLRACRAYLKAFAAAERVSDVAKPHLALEAFLSRLCLQDLYLCLGCSLGDEDAWTRFHESFGEFLRRSSHLLTRRSQAAEEVYSSFYGDLYLPRSSADLRNALSRYAGRARLRTWLRSVLYFRVGDYYARARQGPQVLTSLNLQADAVQDSEALLGVSSAVRERPAPGERLDRQRMLERVIADLPEGFRSLSREDIWLLRQHHEKGRTVEDIGRELNLHRATVSRRLKKIHSKLLARVQERLDLEVEAPENQETVRSLIQHLANRLDFDEILGGRAP